jgi:hypothetical protein
VTTLVSLKGSPQKAAISPRGQIIMSIQYPGHGIRHA